MNYQQSVFDGTENSTVEQSIRLIKEFEAIALHRNPLGYIVGYSGGKDSDVLVDLFRKSGVKFFVKHNHTTLDAPETVYYIRKKFAQWEAEGIPCKIYYPEQSFWSLCLERKMLPLRKARFCCSELKERDIPELKFATHSFGVRKAESVKRSLHRDSIEMNEKVANILRHGDKIEQYAAQYIEELRKENAELKHRTEVVERALKDCSKRLSVFTKSFGDGATEEEVYNKMIKIAEKELSEETKCKG